MISDAYVRVTCDGCEGSCNTSEEIELCALARGGWDERYVEDKLRDRGWKITDDGKHLCDSCSTVCQVCGGDLDGERCNDCETVGYA